VAILLFALGGGMSIYEGIIHLKTPEPVEDPFWNYITLGVALIFESSAWYLAYKEMQKHTVKKGFFSQVSASKDPGVFVVIFEDTAAVSGIIVAFLGVFLGHQFSNPYFDGAASVIIGLILATTSLLLARESKGLLLGEGANPVTREGIKNILTHDKNISFSEEPLTMHFGPNEVLVAVNVQFNADLNAEQIEGVVDRLEKNIRSAHPEVKRIFIEAESIARGRGGVNSM
jgi:divalent metal cation (Fe/Co/Zn/Cd) transporter